MTDFAVQIQRIGNAVQQSQKNGVFQAAMVMKNTIEGERSKAMKGKDHFSRMTQKKTRSNRFVGVRPETNKLSVRFDVKGDMNPTALLVARGPWGLIENGAVRHEITANLGSVKYTKGRGARKRAFKQRSLDVAFGATGLYAGMTPLGNRPGGFGPVYRVKDHPGTRGKQPWKKGVDKSRDDAARIATGIVRNRVVDVIRAGRDVTVYVRGEQGAYKGVVG